MRPVTSSPPDGVFYPESDGQPMADNTLQFRWIVTLAGNLAALFRDDPDVFASGNQFWYPVEGEPSIVIAPDVYVVFGRPKGERPSWKQWEEGGVPMTVVCEVLSPGNTAAEMAEKLAFYEEYGVEEYYIYDPDNNRLNGYVRVGDTLAPIPRVNGFISPRLGIRFDLSGPVLVVRYPDGRPFLPFEELEAERVALAARAERAELQAKQDREQAKQDRERARAVELQAEQDRERAQAAELQAKQDRERAQAAELQAKQDREQAEQDRERAQAAELQAKQDRERAKQDRERAQAAELQAKQDRERAQAAELQAAQLQQRTQELERRSRRLMELNEKILHATATPEEREEFAALVRGDTPNAPPA